MAIESKYKMSRARLEELKKELVYLQTSGSVKCPS
jgi:hypothetical protein